MRPALIRALYLVLGLVIGVAGTGAVLAYGAPDRPSTICSTSTTPLAFREPPPHLAPFSDWLPLPPALELPYVDGMPVWTDGSFHPGEAVADGIRALNAGDRTEAERLVDVLMAHAAGATFPYRFDFGAPPWTQKAPWVSAYTQGLATVLFTRLGRPEAAAIAATLVPNAAGWYEEYPGAPVVVNGDIFAALGLYEYGHATGDQASLRKSLAAIALVRAHIGDFLTTRGIWYDLGHTQRISPPYYQTLTDEFSWLAGITGESCFNDVAVAVVYGHG